MQADTTDQNKMNVVQQSQIISTMHQENMRNPQMRKPIRWNQQQVRSHTRQAWL